MPPPKKRDITLILFDLKVKSRSDALHALSDVLLYKQLSHSKDEYKLYLVNAISRKTASKKLKGAGISSLDLSVNIGTLIEELLLFETGQADWLEALNVAVQEIKFWFEQPGVITLQVVFITDLISFEKPNNKELLTKLINDISNYDIFLYVVGPNIDPPKTIFSYQDVKDWMASVRVDEGNPNLEILKDIVSQTPHSVMCNYDVGVHLFYSYKHFKGKMPWTTPLSFGTVLNIPISAIRVTKLEAPFKLKSVANANRAEEKWAYTNQQDVAIDMHNVVSGLVLHGKFIKLRTSRSFNIEGPRSLKALAFTSAKNVPEYFLQSDSSSWVLPDRNHSQEYSGLFNTLIEELVNLKVYILARKVYNKNCNPVFVVLIPRTDFHTNGFLMCNIPYGDDVVHPYREKEVSLAPDLECDMELYKLLESIDVASETCQIKVPLAPNMMITSSSLNIINVVKEKIIEEKLMLKNVDRLIAQQTDFENLKSEWPVRELEKAKKEETSIADFDDDFI